MSRKEYFKKLKRALFWCFNKQEINEIISDYEEYFEIGLNKGQTTEQIIVNLGSPCEVVNNITQKRITTAPFTAFLKLSIYALLVLGLLVYVVTLNISGYALPKSILLTLLIPIALYWVFGSGVKLRLASYQKPSKQLVLFILCISFTTIAIIFHFRSMLLNILNHNVMPFNLTPEKVGPFLTKYLFLHNIITIILYIWFINKHLKQSLGGFYYTYIFVGSIASVANLKNVLFVLSDVTKIPKATLMCLLPFLLGIILTLLFHFYSKAIYKDPCYECSN